MALSAHMVHAQHMVLSIAVVRTLTLVPTDSLALRMWNSTLLWNGSPDPFGPLSITGLPLSGGTLQRFGSHSHSGSRLGTWLARQTWFPHLRWLARGQWYTRSEWLWRPRARFGEPCRLSTFLTLPYQAE